MMVESSVLAGWMERLVTVFVGPGCVLTTVVGIVICWTEIEVVVTYGQSQQQSDGIRLLIASYRKARGVSNRRLRRNRA